MKSKKLLAIIATISVVIIAGCKKDKTDTTSTTPIVIPIQTTIQPTVPLAGASNFAVLAGSGVTNTGATTITGNLGLARVLR